MFRPRVTWLPPLLLVAAALIPFLGTSYALAFTLTLLSSLVLAQSWDWLGGKTGYTNLGHYAFFGVGAYAFSITVSQGFPVALGLLAAVLVPVALALLLSLPLFRLKGNYFAFATLALIPLFEILALNLDGVTRGAVGIALTISRDLNLIFGLLLAACIATIGVSVWLDRSTFGIALKAIRNDEQAAETSGIRIFPAKAAILALGSAFAGFAGALQAWYLGYIDPHTMFGLDVALVPIAMALFGGSGLTWGPLIGVAILGSVHSTLLVHLPVLQTTAYGLLILLIGRFLPGGLLRLPAIRKTPFLAPLSREHHERAARAPTVDRPLLPAMAQAADAPVLEVRSLVKRFGGNAAINGVSLTVRKGEVIGLVGPNGSGKTTLFNCISKIYEASEGEILLNGATLVGLRRDDVARLGIGRTYQNPRPFGDLSVLENIAIPLMFRDRERLPFEAALREARRFADFAGLAGHLGDRADALSLQDKKVLEFARALAGAPRLLLVDEVASGLTPAEVRRFIDLLRAARDRYGVTIIWVEHIFWALGEIADRIVVFESGTVLMEGPIDAIVKDERVQAAYFGTKKAAA
jgi:branched-chain amino acid transport system permease protein